MGNVATSSPLACGCGQDADATNDILTHFKCKNIRDARESALPQLITGRVCPASHNLKSPVTGRSVVYYFLDVQQQQAKEGQWVPAFSEANAADFVLADQQFPDDCVAVISKGNPNNLRMYSTLGNSYAGTDEAWTASNVKEMPGLKLAAARQQFDLGGTGLFSFASSSGGVKKLRHFEASFEVNMQVRGTSSTWPGTYRWPVLSPPPPPHPPAVTFRGTHFFLPSPCFFLPPQPSRSQCWAC